MGTIFPQTLNATLRASVSLATEQRADCCEASKKVFFFFFVLIPHKTAITRLTVMSSGSKPKPGCFGRDIHRLLLAAEAGQKADILTYSSGHLGPRSLNQSQPHREKKQPFWRASHSQEETPKPLTLQQTQTKALTYVKRKEMKESPSEFSTGTALLESEGLRSRQDQATDCSSHADRREDICLPKIINCSSNSLPVQAKAFSQKKSSSPSDPKGKQQFSSSCSDQEGLNNEGQIKTKQRFGRQVVAQQDLWGGINVAEMHERKLQKELKKLSVQSWPTRDRLVVFSDVFDDVCEGSPVFGRILREIKPNTSLRDLGSSKVREMELEDAEQEVCRLEQEARRALEENKLVRNQLQNVQAIVGPEDSDMKSTSLSGLQDGGSAIGCTGCLQSKRLQVLNMWREIRQLEEEIKEKLVSAATTTSTERRIKDIKTEIMRLIATNDCLKTTNKDLENNINMVLTREKAKKTLRRMLWEEVQCDLQTESE
uniref:Translin-associated factor X-interacting protein 1 N-terminal domain-containing protein n=1 Tax=Dicentrarchus labrax TaxID=13489 RepID=A0A8C4E322_DICLA